MARRHLLFVTGKLAEPALRRILLDLAPAADFDFSVAVLPISVAALTTTPWVARHLTVPAGIDQILLPGLCSGDLGEVGRRAGIPVERGPRDLRHLPDYFGHGQNPPPGYGAHDIEILAEINHVQSFGRDQIVQTALALRAQGADVIDLGCNPGEAWPGARDCVRALKDSGLRVSIDSFDTSHVEPAVAAGAELVLSVNYGNRERAADWGCEVVAIPDVAGTLDGLDETVNRLDSLKVRFRIDPVVEPLGLGFAASLGRYLEVRRRYPNAEMMMGIGNLTELTDVDSAGINVLLAGFCQELRVRSVLTTEVINWCQSAVRELDLARRLVYYATKEKVLPKHLEPDLVMLRDPAALTHGEETLRELAERVVDRHFRIFAEAGMLHVISAGLHVEGVDPFQLFARMQERGPIDPSHAFYLGYEMAKAVTALTLGKNYVQDQALRWGFLTMPEKSDPGTIPPPGDDTLARD
jgi:dihydropteroate synthase-like protein